MRQFSRTSKAIPLDIVNRGLASQAAQDIEPRLLHNSYAAYDSHILPDRSQGKLRFSIVCTTVSWLTDRDSATSAS